MTIQKSSGNATPTTSSSSSAAETAKEIKTLLQQLRKSSNQRQRLLKRKSHSSAAAASKESEREDALRLDKLRRIFARLIDAGELSTTTTTATTTLSTTASVEQDASSKWKAWLQQQHELYVSFLVEGILLGRTTALRSFCGVLATTPVSVPGLNSDSADVAGKDNGNNNTMLSERLLGKLLNALVKSRGCFDINDIDTSTTTTTNDQDEEQTNDIDNERISDEAMLTLFESEFIRPHRDVQYFVLKGLNHIACDLYGKMEETKKNLEKKLKKKSGGDKSSSSEDAKDALLKAEKNVGLVAENMCRILLSMDYIAKTKSDLQDEATFLFTPPVLSGDNGESDDDDHDDKSVDSEDDHDATESSDEDDAAEGNNKGGKRSSSSKSNPKGSKRARTESGSNAHKLIAWQQPYKHRNALQEAWLSVLRLPNLPMRTQKLVLQHLSTYVLGACPSPLRFAEYFTRSFQGGTSTGNAVSGGSGGIAAILSLHGLFILMLHHKLEYPQFYTSLYQLLHPRILYTKHRTRFLRLLSKSLMGNSMLPAYVVGSFCKRLCRLALSGPPSGALFVLALVSNLLRQHGECACLIHRKGSAEGGRMEDVFVEDVDDLVKTRALESSLWELSALQKHYHPAISALAKSCGTEDDKTLMYDMEDFMAHTYKSLFEQEKKRVESTSAGKGAKKGRVSLTFVEPTGLFTKDDVFGDFLKCS